jgi:hypothetical protein
MNYCCRKMPDATVRGKDRIWYPGSQGKTDNRQNIAGNMVAGLIMNDMERRRRKRTSPRAGTSRF